MGNQLALIVEDDKGLRTIYRRVLESIKYEVIEAPDGAVAIDILEEQTPTVLFLDILLPLVNGIDVLEYIYNTPRLHSMHIVIVSSNKQFEKYADEMPSAEFVLKPIRPAQIRALAKGSPA